MATLISDNPTHLAFIHIPKSAGCSISMELIEMEGEKKRKYLMLDNFHGDVHDIHRYRGEEWLTTAEIFAVIRNPWARIFSVWTCNIVTAIRNFQLLEEGRSDLMKPDATEATIEASRKLLSETDNRSFNKWVISTTDGVAQYGVPVTHKTQLSWLKRDGVNIATKILFVEKWDYDYLRSLGINNVQRSNESNGDGLPTNRSYADAFDQGSIEFIRKNFEEDIDYGGYRFGDD